MARPFTVAEIREAYLDFFAGKGCVRYPSASLLPENDPTTLFTVAGMSQFKDLFLGRGTQTFTRATTVQKCIRTNDILNVGRTARHHTFFEMLGNFSFNDYFKEEAIRWAWEFLTERLALDPTRLSISVHRIDEEAYRIWRDLIGIPPDRIFKLGDADNFWPANAPTEGPEGPGGCCSEIFWDHRINDDPKDNLTSSSGRFVEIWNLVFPEYNVRKPNADGSPNLENLGRRNIDTGSGLERVAAVMQGVYNNFDIDVFQTIIASVCAVSGKRYQPATVGNGAVPVNQDDALIRRIADHVRAVTFCIADGAVPGNSDRGYIVRRLIRRATLDLERLGVKEVRLFEIVPAVVEAMGKAYPEVQRRQDLAQSTLKAEEQLFRRTLSKGLDLFQRSLERQRGGAVFSGDDAFDLVTTHGFPREVIAELAGNDGLTIDEKRFQERWQEHTRISNTKQMEVFTTSALQQAKPRLGSTPFVGYRQLQIETDLTLLEVQAKEVTSASAGTSVRFALAATPFYAESGGQQGDRGSVKGADFEISVTDTHKDESLVVHIGTVISGTARLGAVTAVVSLPSRLATTRHHSATHLLHSGLSKILGSHIEQQGSSVDGDQLRFDFNHPSALTRDEITKVEDWVNTAIKAAHPSDIREMAIDAARAAGAKAQFGEKYGERVRVVTFGIDQGISRELCGGCHVENTSDIKAFRIVKEEASSAGIRRIVAVAGDAAIELEAQELAIARRCAHLVGLGQADARGIDELARSFKTTIRELPQRIEQLVQEVKEMAASLGPAYSAGSGTNPDTLANRVTDLQNEAKRLRKLMDAKSSAAANDALSNLLAQERHLGTAVLIAGQCDGLDGKALRQLADLAKSRRDANACIVIGSAYRDGEGQEKVALVALVGPVLVTAGVQAGALIAHMAPVVGGRGGGKADLAQAGGTQATGLPKALAMVEPWLRGVLRLDGVANPARGSG